MIDSSKIQHISFADIDTDLHHNKVFQEAWLALTADLTFQKVIKYTTYITKAEFSYKNDTPHVYYGNIAARDAIDRFLENLFRLPLSVVESNSNQTEEEQIN
jgi:hypothetical protein